MLTIINRTALSIKQLIASYNNNRYYSNMQPANYRNIYKIQDSNVLVSAAEYLKNGYVIGLPTDTVYGLACDANNEYAMHHLYEIKGRDVNKPVAICVKDLVAFRKYGQTEHLSNTLLKQLLPGPITIVVDRSQYLNNRFLNPSTNKIGIRIPDYSFIQQLCELYHDQPLALTSANVSSEQSSLTIYEFQKLWPLLGGIFDAGPIGSFTNKESRSGSTVVDLSEVKYYKIIREGTACRSIVNILNLHGLKLIGGNLSVIV